MSYDLDVPISPHSCRKQPAVQPARPARKRCSSIGRRCAVTLAYCGVAYAVVSSSVPVYLQALRLEGEAAQVRVKITEAEEKHTTLEVRVQELQTPEGEQNAARSYGWLLKGERAIACPHPDNALSHTSDARFLALAPVHRPSVIERLKQAVEW